jgi:hypothetical protein
MGGDGMVVRSFGLSFDHKPLILPGGFTVEIAMRN